MRYTYAKITFRILLISFLALLLIGCGEKGTPGGASQPGMTAVISLTSGASTLSADGVSSTSITATLTDSTGQPVDQWTGVTFKTTLGTFINGKQEYKVSTPDTTGRIIVSLRSGITAGTADITVTSNGLTQHLAIEFVKALPPASIVLSAMPSTVNPLGSVTITATVKNVVEAPVEGETVVFSIKTNASGGSLDSNNLSVQTNVNGEASVTYTAGGIKGTDVIQASVTSNGISSTVTVVVDPEATVVGSISVIAGSGSLVADGVSQTVIRATVTDINGNPASGKTVNFETTAGTLSETSAVTDSNGIAEVMLTASNTTGTTTVRGGCDGFIDNTTIEFIAGVASQILMYAFPDTVNPDDTFNLEAAVMDSADNRLSGERVKFLVREKGKTEILNTAEQITDDDGIVRQSFTAFYGEMELEVTAETNNGTKATVIVTVDADALVVGSISLTAGDNAIPADGVSTVAIRATVLDKDGQPAKDTDVRFDTTLGTLSQATKKTDDTGIAEVTLTSATTAGTATVTADSHGFKAEAQIKFQAAKPQTIDVDVVPGTVIPGGSASIIATVTDIYGNPVSGEKLNFKITQNNSNSSMTGSSQTSDGNGQIFITYTAGPDEGTDKFLVTADSDHTVSGSASLRVDKGLVLIASMTLTSGASSMIADGVSTTTLRATVTNTYGEPAAGVSVSFQTTSGSVSPSSKTTNSLGIADAVLTSSTTAGTANVTANAGGFTQTVNVDFVAGPPATGGVTLTATPANLTADGVSTSVVNITVLDANNNPVNGEKLTLSVDFGTLDKLTVTTVDGKASATYTSPTSKPAGGRATVTARTTNNVEGTTNIMLTGTIVAGITLTAYPESIPANGISQTTIKAVVTAVGGGNVPDGTEVTFSIKSGGGSLDPATATTAGGEAITFLTSAATPGTATIQATCGGRISEIDIEYTAGSVSLTIIPNSILGTGQETATVTATVLNVDDDPDPGKQVTITIDDLSLGRITSTNPDTTDSNGEVQFTFEGAAKGGTATLTATTEDGLTASATIEIQPPPAFIQVADGYPNPTSINIKGTGGQSTSQIVFDVKDIAGHPVANGYRVDLQILDGPNGGEAIEPTSTVTSDGQVSTILRSGTKSGPVSIKATYYYDTNVSTVTAQIAISAGPPVGEEFGVFAQYLNISGLWRANLLDDISVNVGDIYGNAVPDGTAISFKTYNTGGFFTPNTANTSGGLATNTLHSGGTYTAPQGFLTVTAETNNGGRTTHVRAIGLTPAPHDNIIYVGTDGGGVYKSTDYGATWANVSRTSDQGKEGQNYIDPYINDISVDPDDFNTVYAATGYLGRGNIYRSIDGGITWQSGNFEHWYGLLGLNNAVLAVLCDGSGSDYVWAGTEGLGAIFAPDGENFQWGGLVDSGPTFAGTGNGSMTTPMLSVTSKTETWTATYTQTSAVASNPVLTGSQADGTIYPLVASDTANDEDWTLVYAGDWGTATYTASGAPATSPSLTITSIGKDTVTESWTVECVDNTTSGQEKWIVYGTVSGLQGDQATTAETYTIANKLTFYILGSNYQVGDTFTFTTTADRWTVTGSVSGANTDTKTGVAYTSDNSEVSFTINGGSLFYRNGDTWTFHTTPIGEWLVYGTVSGTQSKNAMTDIPYVSDNGEVSFTITKGTIPFAPGDTWTFHVTESGLGYGKIVRDVVKASGSGSGATLYAATAFGVYKTTDGGILWHPTTRFTGDNITCLAVHPTATSTVYAGTEDAGVWYTTNGGTNWTQYNSGLGRGLSATTPIPDVNNTGNGVMSEVSVKKDTKSENWTVYCFATAPDGGTFSITGSVSGGQGNYDVPTDTFSFGTIPLDFTITDGSTDFAVGDTFTFSTTRDPGTKIKDILVDSHNDYLYAITYFNGPLEPHAVGNVYSLELAGSGAPAGSDWAEANTGLPQYDPPDDTSLFPLHALAADDQTNPTAFYIGAEGINFDKATTGFATGNPSWLVSKSGLTNLVMARMPILFTGQCTMNIASVEHDEDTGEYTYTVYIQDVNGNPPIVGSNFTVKLKCGDKVDVIFKVDYPDAYAFQGTWSDPADPDTNNPFIIRVIPPAGCKVIFSFTPTCEDTAPGCSGSNQEITYTY